MRNIRCFFTMLLLSAVLLVSPPVYATNIPGSTVYAENSGSIDWINPLVKPEDRNKKLPISDLSTRSVEQASSLDELHQKISQNIYNREAFFEVYYTGDTSDFKTNLIAIMKKIFADHYLYYSTEQIHASYAMEADNQMKVTIQASYWQTKQQDEFVDQQVQKIIASIIKPGMNNHEKEKAVHDYVVTHVEYDYDLVEHSAYAALAQGKTVCQGYATLTYKLLKQAGIENQIVLGSYGNILHTWNLVHLDNKWYHLDTTWDSSKSSPDHIDYEYYNRSDSEILYDHSIDDNTTDTFLDKVYPPADTVYYDDMVLFIESNPDQALRYKHLLQSLEFDVSNIQAFYEWEKKVDVAANKTWTVHFNKPVAANIASGDSIIIRDEVDQFDMNPALSLSADKKSVLVLPPEEGYTSGHTYSLIIHEQTSSETGEKIKDPIRMRFTIH